MIEQELQRAGLHAPHNTWAASWLGPALLIGGTDAQRQRFLWPMIKGEETWSRLHSEPDAGSDPAMIATRALRAGEEFRISGQKIWSANAGNVDYGGLLARTSGQAGDPTGVSYFLLPMDTPGITIRPIRDLAGRTLLNDVSLMTSSCLLRTC
jgi:alkylation response protein AidB-like acyl-CoA dehydrogenase